jgi:hypothetical protein
MWNNNSIIDHEISLSIQYISLFYLSNKIPLNLYYIFCAILFYLFSCELLGQRMLY